MIHNENSKLHKTVFKIFLMIPSNNNVIGADHILIRTVFTIKHL